MKEYTGDKLKQGKLWMRNCMNNLLHSSIHKPVVHIVVHKIYTDEVFVMQEKDKLIRTDNYCDDKLFKYVGWILIKLVNTL